MSITHETVVTKGHQGTPDEWNADHVVSDESRPKNNVTLIVAASNSLDTTRADYVCDGVDDDETIQEAINALPAWGGSIVLLEGTFNLSNLIYTENYVQIRGQGYSTILATTGNHRVVSVASDDGVILQDFLVSGSGAGNAANDGVYISLSNNVTVHNVRCENCGGNGIEVTGVSDDVHLSDNFMLNNEGHGIYAHGTSRNIIFSGNHGNSNGGNGIFILNSTAGIFTDNVTEENVNHGILVSGSSDNIISNNQSSGNDSGNTASFDGICVQSNSDNNVITGNRCRDNDRNEIRIDDATCDKNVVVGNNAVGTLHAADIVDNGTNSVVANNAV